jgi:hypothetical protein
VTPTVDLEQLRALRTLRRAFGDVQVLEVRRGWITPTRQPELRRRQVPNLAHSAQASLLEEKGGGLSTG